MLVSCFCYVVCLCSLSISAAFPPSRAQPWLYACCLLGLGLDYFFRSVTFLWDRPGAIVLVSVAGEVCCSCCEFELYLVWFLYFSCVPIPSASFLPRLHSCFYVLSAGLGLGSGCCFGSVVWLVSFLLLVGSGV